MANLDVLRKLIREEVRGVFQEELSGILKEAILYKNGSQPIIESTNSSKPKIPGTLNTQTFKPAAIPNFGANNPLNNILQETALSMTSKDVDMFGMGRTQTAEAPVVESVDGMFASARKSSNLEAIEINAVPDFSGIMAKMKANGEV